MENEDSSDEEAGHAQSKLQSDTEPTETSRYGARPKRYTEKGRLYNLGRCTDRLTRLASRLGKKMVEINQLMTATEDRAILQDHYINWISMYEDYLHTRQLYKSLLGAEEDAFLEQDITITCFNSTLERWSREHQPDVQPSDSISQAGSLKPTLSNKGGSKVSSRVSSTKRSIASSLVREEEKRMELEMRIQSFQKKRELELTKLQLKLQERQLELDTELAISQAKSKMLNEFNRKSSTFSDSPKLRANAPSFIPNTNKPRSIKGVSKQNNDKTTNSDKPVYYFDSNTHLDLQAQHDLSRPVTHGHMSLVSDNPKPLQDNSFNQHDDITSVVRELRKPTPELQPFSGDPLEYRRFIRQFTSKILSNTEDNEERLNYLDQFTKGEAHKIVRGYGYLKADTGYPSAIKELDERYGNDEALANAFVKRALDWPAIKADSAKALDEYGIFLAECCMAIHSIEAVKVLEYPDNLRRLIGKLPYFYHGRWSTIVDQHRTRYQPIKFDDLVDFVKTEARKASDPLFGRDALRDCNTRPVPKTQRYTARGTFATNIVPIQSEITQGQPACGTELRSFQATERRTAFTSPCIYCDKPGHTLEHCLVLQGLGYDDRMSILKDKRLCYGCLKYGHQSRDCRSKSTCQHCKGRHPSLCHDDNFKRRFPKEKPKQTDSKTYTSASISCQQEDVQCNTTMESACTMAILPVTVRLSNGVKVIETYAFMDPGSSASFCTESLLRQLGGSGKPRRITLETMGSQHPMLTFEVNNLEVGNLNMEHFLSLPTVYTKDKLPVSVNHIPTTEDIKQWPHMKNVKLPKIEAEVGLLIGNNVADAYSPLETRTGSRGSPHATRSLLGWIAWNVTREVSTNRTEIQTHTVNRTAIVASQEIEALKDIDLRLRQSINLDFPEHVIDDKKENSQEDKRFLQQVHDSLKLENGHYSINLPFKNNNNTKFPNNESQARQRLKGLKAKMTTKLQFAADYRTFMSNILEKGYAELVSPEDLVRSDGRVWFIPHHGVYHPHKPDKIRVVFDCSAQFQGISLNSQLLQGPDLTNSLLSVLLKFRQNEIGLMADVESMFYQVRVPEEDRDCLRFLWWPDGDTDRYPLVYRMTVHLFGAVSSPSCSNAALRQTADDNNHAYPKNVVDTVKHSFYVDDCLVSVPSEEEAVSLIASLADLCQKGGFHLTKWSSNNRKALSSVENEERAKGLKTLNLDCDKLPNERALGIHWITEDDVIGFKIEISPKPPTKRGILSTVSSIYDPLGLAAPFTLTGRVILQNLCNLGLDWDQEIPGNLLTKWHQWVSQLPLLENLNLARCYKPIGFDEVVHRELHVFSDASESGYGVAIYLRLTNVHQDHHCILVLGKSRVTPLKGATIPRMELTAATTGVRLSRLVSKELDLAIHRVYFWKDSMSVIRYVSNETTRFSTFVANRIAVIRDGSNPDQWRYVESKLNPADSASRGINIQKFLNDKEWLNGPSFLWQQELHWPQTDLRQRKLSEDDVEVKEITSSTIQLPEQQSDVIHSLIHRHSEWLKLRRVMGWVLHAVEKFKSLLSQKRTSKKKVNLADTYLTVDILKKAEHILVKHAQNELFGKELEILNRDKQDNQRIIKIGPLRKLDPFLQDGLIRVGGRLRRADIPFHSRHPVIIPKNSHICTLYLRYVHSLVGHLGKNSMLAKLREKYWIPGATTSIKSLVSKCVICRRYQSRRLNQKMADLPTDRLIPGQPPFTSVGMDYFGPMEIKRGRSSVKRYGVIFTCLTSRAVHLELAASLTTDSCVNAIRRFVSRRGPVNVIRSDNGTNLVGSRRELKEALEELNQAKISKYLQRKDITWKFNPPTASHHGGVWERLIRSVRKILYSILQHQAGRPSLELYGPSICAAYAACSLIKECNRKAFDRSGRSSITGDMVDEIQSAFQQLYT